MIETAMVSAAAVAILLICEIAARLADGVPLWPLDNFLASRSAMIGVHTALRSDPEIGWALRENLCWDGGLHVINHGLRVDPAAVPQDLADSVLVVGGSFSLGSGVLGNEAWPVLLEAKLRALGLETGPSLNAGCGGWALDQMCLRAKRLCSELKPRVVIIAFTPINIEDVALTSYAGMAKPYFELADRDGEPPVFVNSPVPRTLVPLSALPAAQRVLGFSYLAYWLAGTLEISGWRPPPATNRRSCDYNALSLAILRDFDRFAREQGVRALYIMQYGVNHLQGRVEKPYSWITRFIDEARASGMDVLDMWSWIHGDYRARGDIALLDWFLIRSGEWDHPSVGWHHRTAELVAAHLVGVDQAPSDSVSA